MSICKNLQRSVFNRLPVYLQVLDLLMQVIRGNLSVQIQVSIFGLKIPAGQVQVDLQVNSWHALRRSVPLRRRWMRWSNLYSRVNGCMRTHWGRFDASCCARRWSSWRTVLRPSTWERRWTWTQNHGFVMNFTCRSCWTTCEWSWMSALECLSVRRTYEKAKKAGGGVLMFKKT